jgi:hypothetical protein
MSSSQGANTGAVVGYAYDTDSLRDASDWTRQLKEQRAYRSYSTNNTGNKNTGSEPWIKYGNQFRYTYLFGKFKCGGCLAINSFSNGVVGGA